MASDSESEKGKFPIGKYFPNGQIETVDFTAACGAHWAPANNEFLPKFVRHTYRRS